MTFKISQTLLHTFDYNYYLRITTLCPTDKVFRYAKASVLYKQKEQWRKFIESDFCRPVRPIIHILSSQKSPVAE